MSMLQDLLRFGFLLLIAPIWLPFARAMLHELKDLFEEDGGLFGSEPGPRGREVIRARRALRPSPVVHEWVAHIRPDSVAADQNPLKTTGRKVVLTGRDAPSPKLQVEADRGRPPRAFR